MIGKLERFIVEKDGNGQPTSWLEIVILRDVDDPQLALPGQSPLPFSEERLNSPETRSLKTKLEGVWKPVRAERAGAPIPAATVDEIGPLRIEGNRLFPFDRDSLHSIWGDCFRLDSSKKPNQITIFSDGPEGELAFHGIYSLEGNALTICLNENGKDTAVPDDFRTKEASPFILFHFRRGKR